MNFYQRWTLILLTTVLAPHAAWAVDPPAATSMPTATTPSPTTPVTTPAPTVHTASGSEPTPEASVTFGEVFAYKYKWTYKNTSPNRAPDKYETKKSQAVEINAASGDKACSKWKFVMSAQELNYDQAETFCAGLNEDAKTKGAGKWALADLRQAADLRIKCGVEKVLEQAPFYKSLFPESRRGELPIWIEAQGVPNREFFPWDVATYPMRNVVSGHEMDPVSHRPVTIKKAPALCVLNP